MHYTPKGMDHCPNKKSNQVCTKNGCVRFSPIILNSFRKLVFYRWWKDRLHSPSPNLSHQHQILTGWKLLYPLASFGHFIKTQTIFPIPPAYKPNVCEWRTTFDHLNLHKIFGCCKFWSSAQPVIASKNAANISGGKLPPTPMVIGGKWDFYKK